ncbi:MAG TPA: regulatory protein RecX [Chitinophagaceae bacterium]|jgi:regulatory protein|nr:regulatory protein RecX [Chitinophagaceae bacterium]
MQKKYLTREQALQKLKHYCGYQERSQYEAVQKLYELGVSKSEHDDILSALIEENYINEERFAVEYAGGKFRMKDWGRKKIYYGLKEKKISEYCIKAAMKSIDEEDYLKTLSRLAEKKHESLKGEQYLSRKKKISDYLLQKGYEPDLINKAIASLANN